jgi:hypothetical protein
MNFKTTFILLIIFLAVGAYLFFSTRGGGGETDDKAREQLVLDVPVGEVTQIGISAANGDKLLMEKRGEEWRILQPVQAKADSWQAEQLATAIVGMKHEGHVDRENADAAKTVTDKPAYHLELTTKDNKTRKIAVGQKTVVGNTTFVQVDGKGRVYVVSGEIHERLGKPASEYRQTQLVSATTSQLNRIELQAADRTLTLARQDGNWQITAPTTMPAERSAVESLAGSLTALRANEFVATDTPATKTGLESPRLTVRFTADGKDAATVVKIGNYTDLLKKHLYAQAGDGPIATITSFAYDSLNKGPLDLRSKDVMRVDAKQVSAVTIAYDLPATTQPTTQPARSGEVRLTKKTPDLTMGPALPTTAPATAPAAEVTESEAKWTVEGREGAVADADVDDLLRQFDPLKATKFVTEAPEDVTGRYTIRLTLGEGNSQQVELIQPATGSVVAKHQDLAFEVGPGLSDAVKKIAGLQQTPAQPATEE